MSRQIQQGQKSTDPLIRLITEEPGSGLQIVNEGTGNAIELVKPDGTTLWYLDKTGNTSSSGGSGVSGVGSYVQVTAAPYNADPTGATDSTAAFKSAIAAIDGATKFGLYVPTGTYKINSTLFFPTAQNVSKLGVYFEPGATLQWSDTGALTGGLGATQAIFQVFTSDLDMWNIGIVGKTAQTGNGIGVLYGSGPNICKTTTATLNPGDTSVAVSNGLLTYIRNGDYFNLVDAGTGYVETCKLSAGEGTNTWTIARAQRGTTALTFASGTYVQPPYFPQNKNGHWVNTQTEAYRCNLWSPYLQNLGIGIVYGIDEQPTTSGGSGNSCGDNDVFGGYITGCGTGILNRGFVNRGVGVTIASCLIGVDAGGPDYTNPGSGDSVTLRTSHKWEQHSFTMNQNQTCAVWVRGGDGTLINGLWCENNGGQATQQVRIGQTVAVGGVSKTAYNTTGDGTWTLSADSTLPGDSVLKILNAAGTRIRHIRYSTNGGKVSTAVVMGDASLTLDSANRVARISAWPGSGNKNKMSDGSTLPAPYLNASTADNSLIVQEHFEPDSRANAGATIGDADFLPSAHATYTVFKETGNGVTTYYAKNRVGHLVTYGTDTSTTSGLKAVLSVIAPAANPGSVGSSAPHIHFTNGRFQYLDAPLGTESWAGVEDHYAFVRLNGIKITGEGMDKTIISNRTNQIAASPDTEPFSFTSHHGLNISDLTLESCGRAKSTTDGIDLDDVWDGVLERVCVRHSRAKAITIDGGYNGQHAGWTTFRDLLIHGRPRPPQLDNAGSGVGTGLTNGTTYQYAHAWVLNDLGVLTPTASSYSAGTLVFTVPAVPPAVQVGHQINVTGMTPSGYNGTWRVSAVTATTITVDSDWATGTTISDPGGVGTVFGTLVCPDETKPSDQSQYVAATSGGLWCTNYVNPGPYNCVGVRIYRTSGGGVWKLVTTLTPATVTVNGKTQIPLGVGIGGNDSAGIPLSTTYNDGTPDASLTTVTLTNNQKSSIPDMGIELMACRGCKIQNCIIDGTGDMTNGVNQQGIYVVRKSVTAAGVTTQYHANNNVIMGNTIRQTGQAGIKILGGNKNVVTNNQVMNPGNSTTYAAIRLEFSSPATTDDNIIANNWCSDDQSANTWQAAVGMNNGINVTSASINRTIIQNNAIAGGSSTGVANSGTGSMIHGNNGYLTEAYGSSTQTPGAVTTVNIAHGLAATPTLVNVNFGDINSRGAPAFYITVSSSNITLNFASSLTAATSYTWYWNAAV